MSPDPKFGQASSPPIALRAESRTIEVNGKAASMLHIGRGDGVAGVYTEVGQDFRVSLENRLKDDKTLVHWHGLRPDFKQDGVPNVSQPALEPGGLYDYDFPLTFPGTFWMHSHYELQEQRLMAAPLIIRDPAEAHLDEQEVVIMLHDFTFRDPDEILAGLRKGEGNDAMMAEHGHTAAGHGEMASEMPMSGEAMSGGMMSNQAMTEGMAMGGMMVHANDIEYDAYLANDRTIGDPEVVRVEPGGRIRLRIINAGSSTNFQINLGALAGEVIAVDGFPVAPVRGKHFPMTMAQRLDIRLQLPTGQGAYVNGLGRASDAPGKASWVNSTFTDVQLLLGFSESPESIARLDGFITTLLTNLADGFPAEARDALTEVNAGRSGNPTLAIAAVESSVSEGDSGSTPFLFTVSRSDALNGVTTVDWAVSTDGLAFIQVVGAPGPEEPDDFLPGTAFPSGTVTFLAGESEQTISISVSGDTTPEIDNVFQVTLSNLLGGAEITTDTATGTILNDDGAITLSAAVDLDDVALDIGGFKIIGENPGDLAGIAVSSAGDVNGDGFGDLIVGSYANDSGGENAGATYVVFGAASGMSSVLQEGFRMEWVLSYYSNNFDDISAVDTDPYTKHSDLKHIFVLHLVFHIQTKNNHPTHQHLELTCHVGLGVLIERVLIQATHLNFGQASLHHSQHLLNGTKMGSMQLSVLYPFQPSLISK